jgi:MFS family permease
MSEMPPPATVAVGADAAEPKAHLTHRQILIVFSGLMLGMFLAALDNTIVNTALNNIVGDLGGQSQLTWVVTSYLLTSTITILLWGKLSDIYGRKVMFQISIALFLAASALVGLSPTMMFLVVARGVQGVGAGGIMSLAFAIIGDILSPRERGKYMGLMGSVFLVAMVVGPAVGGLIVDHVDLFGIAPWRWVFYINLPIGIPALFITQVVLKLPFHKRKEPLDGLGFALLAVGTAAIILGLTWAGQGAPWNEGYNLRWGPGVGDASSTGQSLSPSQELLGDWLVPTLMLGGALFTALFVVRQAKARVPLLPLHIFKERNYALGSIVSFVVGMAMFGGFVFLPTYLQMSTGVSATLSGFLMLPLMAGMFPSMTISGILVSKTGKYKRWPVIGLPVGAAGLALLSLIEADTPQWLVGLGMFLLGIGIGLTMQVIVVAVQNVLEPRDLGIGTSANTFMRQMGGVFGVGIFGAYFAHRVIGLAQGAVPIAVANGVDPATIGSSFSATPGAVKDFPEPLRDYITGGFADIIGNIFLFAAPVMLLAWVVVLFLKEIPLRTARSVGGQRPAAADPTVGAEVAVERVVAPQAMAAYPTAGANGPAPQPSVREAPRRQWYHGYEIGDLQARVDQATRRQR